MNDLTEDEYKKICERASIDYERLKIDPAYKIAVTNIVKKELEKNGVFPIF